MTNFPILAPVEERRNQNHDYQASASSTLKCGDKLPACPSASVRRFASWKLAATFSRSQGIRLEDALATGIRHAPTALIEGTSWWRSPRSVKKSLFLRQVLQRKTS
jgi:hypothetical protein